VIFRWLSEHFVHTPGKNLRVVTAGDEPTLESGQELIGLNGVGF
jgi:hypothetical protein